MEKKYQLPKEFAEKWVKALRSGEYRQIKGVFSEKENCYCANGLAYASNGCKIYNHDQVDYNGVTNSIWNSTGILPVQPELVDIIVRLNDDHEMDFTDIADWLESNVEFI